MNYITKKLKNEIKNIKKNMSNKYLNFFNQKVDDIIKIFNYDDLSYKKYNQLKLGVEYVEISTNNIILTQNNTSGFEFTEKILKKMNSEKIFKLYLMNNIVINLHFYYHNSSNIEILYENINKIITRLWNLYVIHINKTFIFNNTQVSPKLMTYKFYLYSNIRRANQNFSGSKYLKNLNNTDDKCFNTSSGQIIFNKNDNIIVVSKLEETLGLLTHEFLHCCGLILLNMSKIPNINMKFSFLEMYVNAFASIYHSYLLSKELNNIKYTFKKILRTEVFHSIVQLVKLFKISGFSLEQIYNRNPNNMIIWYQDAYIYEYIVGRFLILMNFKYIMENNDFKNNLLSRNEGWKNTSEMNKYAIDIIIHIHNYNHNILKLFNHINMLCIIPKNNDTTICGNMIMQYFCYDPLIVEKIDI